MKKKTLKNELTKHLSKAGKSTFNKYGSEHYKNIQKLSVEKRKSNKKDIFTCDKCGGGKTRQRGGGGGMICSSCDL